MNKINLTLILLFTCSLACRKSGSDSSQPQNISTETKYRLYDSVIKVIDNTSSGSVIQEDHYTLNREIKIYTTQEPSEVIVNTDTFILYTYSPLVYTHKNNNFPLLRMNGDSITIYRHLGGVGYQTWEYILGVKLY